MNFKLDTKSHSIRIAFLQRATKAQICLHRLNIIGGRPKDPRQIDAITTRRWFVLLLFLLFILFLSRDPFTLWLVEGGGGQRYIIHTNIPWLYHRGCSRLCTQSGALIYMPLRRRQPKNRFTILAINPITPFLRLAYAVASRLLFLSAPTTPPPPTTHHRQRPYHHLIRMQNSRGSAYK